MTRQPTRPPAATDEDGLAAQDAMSELFVTADRLMKDPDDRDDVARFSDAQPTRPTRCRCPTASRRRCGTTSRPRPPRCATFSPKDRDEEHDDVTEAANALRQTLRQYV